VKQPGLVLTGEAPLRRGVPRSLQRSAKLQLSDNFSTGANEKSTPFQQGGGHLSTHHHILMFFLA
jgi:hypothetical protein